MQWKVNIKLEITFNKPFLSKMKANYLYYEIITLKLNILFELIRNKLYASCTQTYFRDLQRCILFLKNLLHASINFKFSEKFWFKK